MVLIIIHIRSISTVQIKFRPYEIITNKRGAADDRDRSIRRDTKEN
jgi:hypothetical protein